MTPTLIGTLFVIPFFFSTQDIVSETHKVETVARAICYKALDGKWENLHMPQARCVPREVAKPNVNLQ